jgi:putative flippase GtrA
MDKIKELFQKYREIILYLVFGVMTTAIGWAVYFIVLWAWKAAFSLPVDDTSSGLYIAGYTAAQVIQWIAAVLFAFFTNRAWVFTAAEKNVSIPVQLVKFSAGRVATFVIDYVVTFFGGLALSALFAEITAVSFFGRDWNLAEITAKIVAAVIVIVCNYIFSKIFVFKNKKKQ